MADDNKQDTYSQLSIQTFYQQVFMERELPSFVPSALGNMRQAWNRPTINDFTRRLGRQAQQGK